MCKKVLIYGISQQAQQLYKYITADSNDRVIAFIADGDYIKEPQLLGLPVIAFEVIQSMFAPQEYEVAVSFAYTNMMYNRQTKFEACKAKGYQCYSFISTKANVYADAIGEGCIVYPGCTVAPFVKLGRGNFLEIGVSVGHHTCIGDFSFFAPNATICGDVTIGDHCFFGAGCIVRNSITVANNTLIGAGAYLNSSSLEARVYKPQCTQSHLGVKEMKI